MAISDSVYKSLTIDIYLWRPPSSLRYTCAIITGSLDGQDNRNIVSWFSNVQYKSELTGDMPISSLWINVKILEFGSVDLSDNLLVMAIADTSNVLLGNTLECCYNAGQYYKVLYIRLQELRQNISQMLVRQKLTHSSYLRARYGVFLWIFEMKLTAL